MAASASKTTVLSLLKVARRRKITLLTAYDYASAIHVCRAGIDILLVGDSLGMVELGYDTTQPVTVEMMLHHCKAVKRGAKYPLIVGDLPFGSYEVTPEQALETAIRFVKEAGVDAVKLEGGVERAEHVKKIVSGGIAVMGHVGLLPQSISVLGGFTAQGRTAEKARALVDDALAVQEAGAFSCVVECVPSEVGSAITEALKIPTIGIGAGPYTGGQALVYHDMLGFTEHPQHVNFVPRFCKKFACVGDEVTRGLEAYRHDVLAGTFPGEEGEYSPYILPPKEAELLEASLKKDGIGRTETKHQKLIEANEQTEDNNNDSTTTGPYGGS
eukprot:220459_1